QTDQGSDQQDPVADPDPRNQWEYVGLNYSAFIVICKPGEIDVQILVQTPPDSYLGGRSAAGLIHALFGLECGNLFSAARDVERKFAPDEILVFTILLAGELEIISANRK